MQTAQENYWKSEAIQRISHIQLNLNIFNKIPYSYAAAYRAELGIITALHQQGILPFPVGLQFAHRPQPKMRQESMEPACTGSRIPVHLMY